MPTAGATATAEPLADAAPVPHKLTRELLDEATNLLTAILQTPEVRQLARPRDSLRDTLKQLDHLWPYATEGA